MPRKDERAFTIFLEPATDEWLKYRAHCHGRAKLREAVSILEAERAREARAMSGGVLHAQGKNR